MENYKIYYLISDTENIIRYVGQTKSTLRKRLSGHRSEDKHNPHKNSWMGIHKKNVRIVLIEENIPTLQEANAREIYWIAYYRDLLGKRTLLNQTDGGDGTTGRRKTEIEKKNLSERNKGKILTDEHKQKISESEKGCICNEYTKEVNRKAQYKFYCIRHGHDVTGLTDEQIFELRNEIHKQIEMEKLVSSEKKKLMRKKNTV